MGEADIEKTRAGVAIATEKVADGEITAHILSE
jgi:hypothetical protein